VPKTLPQADSFNLIIVTPDETIYEGKATRLLAPGYLEEFAVLPNHTPFYAEIKPGKLKYIAEGSSEKTIDVESGIVRVKSNQASVLLGFADKKK
jgi:F-type H+-transporting ATPase subunit epsilon